MNEAAAREVTLLQAFETAQPPSPSWGDDDRAWANRVALEASGAGAAPDEFIAQRARHALQRLAPRERQAARWLAQPRWRLSAVAGLAAIAFVLGLLADSIGAGQRINLLAPPLWGVLGWNALVYLGLLVAAAVAAVRRVAGREPVGAPPGFFKRGMQALAGLGRGAPAGGAGNAAWSRFARLWAARGAPLAARRVGVALHVAAAALALGLIAGLYARGLVLDYRAAWQSTFLAPPVAHAVVGTVLAPASKLSGIGLPDAAGFAALQVAGPDVSSGAPAGPWIHLFALTLGLFVVLPRAVLAFAGAARAGWGARHFRLPLDDDYFQRLLRLQRGGAAEVQVWPYAFAPSPQAVLGLRALLAEALGSKVGLQIAPAVAFGAEDEPVVPLPGAPSHALAWFDLGATPEAEHHARFARQLAASVPAGASVLVLVDEAAFRRRFGRAAPERLAQRRDAWGQLGQALDTVPVFADFEAIELKLAEPALQAALVRPVRRSADASNAPADALRSG